MSGETSCLSSASPLSVDSATSSCPRKALDRYGQRVSD